MRPAELRTLLRTDDTAWLDTFGALYFVDPGVDPARRASTAAASPAADQVAPLPDTFLLHSNPGSNLTILLDFNGAVVSGTSWNTQKGVSTSPQPAWDPDGDGPAFNDHEKLMVQQVWAFVAEDYASFDVDVTTEDPGTAGLIRSSASDTTYGTRVLVTPSDDSWQKTCGQQCGGIAYTGVFDQINSTYLPAWVFPQGTTNNPKAVAEAAAHEAGHNLSLLHDGNASEGYDSGHGIWASIMGVGYYRPLTQWSQGSYTDANNHQDDLHLIAGYLGVRPDEAPGSQATPVGLPAAKAVISAPGDVDSYLLGSCSPGTVVDVHPAEIGADLDVRAVLYDATGTERSVSAPASGDGDPWTASGLGGSLTIPATGTGWVLTVDGVGEGDWTSDGYDDYGSLGAYTVTAPGCDGAVGAGTPSAPTTVSGATAGTGALTLSWDAPAAPGNGPVTGYVVSYSGSTGSEVLPADARDHTFTGLVAGMNYLLSVRAINATGGGPTATVTAQDRTGRAELSSQRHRFLPAVDRRSSTPVVRARPRRRGADHRLPDLRRRGGERPVPADGPGSGGHQGSRVQPWPAHHRDRRRERDRGLVDRDHHDHRSASGHRCPTAVRLRFHPDERQPLQRRQTGHRVRATDGPDRHPAPDRGREL